MDDMGAIAQVGVAGLVVLIVLEKSYAFVSKMRGNGPNGAVLKELERQAARMEYIARKTADLHTWHDVDQDGVKVWYTVHLKESLERLTKVIEQQTKAMRDHIDVMKDVLRDR